MVYQLIYADQIPADVATQEYAQDRERRSGTKRKRIFMYICLFCGLFVSLAFCLCLGGGVHATHYHF